MSEFDKYIVHEEPGQKEKADAWQTAIGLQDMDGLKVSDHLLDTARQPIEGDITIDKTRERIKAISKSQIDILNCTLEELAILRIIENNPKSTQTYIAKSIKKSASTVKRITSSLVEKEILIRRNGRRNGWWEIQSE